MNDIAPYLLHSASTVPREFWARILEDVAVWKALHQSDG